MRTLEAREAVHRLHHLNVDGKLLPCIPGMLQLRAKTRPGPLAQLFR
jgi:hypothetical protein